MNTPKKINDGGQAFPGFNSVEGYGNSKPVVKQDQTIHFENYATGMSLRVHCAVTVLPALVSLVTAEDMKKFTPEQCHQRCARGAVMLADALIAELEKPA